MSNEYTIKKTNPEGTKTRWVVQRVSKTNQPIGKAEIFSTEDAAKRFVASKSEVKESVASSILKGILAENGEPVSVVYIDGKAVIKYTNIDDAKEAVDLMKKKHPKKNFEIKQEVREAGYGQSIRKFKPKVAGMKTEAEEKMKPVHVDGEEKSGAVATLEKRLLAAKKRGDKLSYGVIDRMMQRVCKEHQLTGDKLHDDFVKKHKVVPDKWIVKQKVTETEAIKGADGKRCWKGKRYAGTVDGKDKCVPVKNETANSAQQAAIAIAKKSTKKVDEGVIAESKMSDIVKPLVRAFNLEHGGDEKWADMMPLHTKSSAKRWRRGDGSYYTDPSKIVAFDQNDTNQRALEKQFFSWLTEQPGAKRAGQIRGEFKSSDYAEAAKFKGLIFINRGSYTEYTTPSRLRNPDVWHQQTDKPEDDRIQDESSIMKGLTT